MTFEFGIFDSFDLGTGTPGDIVAQRLALAAEAERVGIGHYHVTEHHGTPLSVIPAPNLFLAALSQTTSTMRIGAMVYVLPMYEPLRLAEEIAVLDHFSGGRVDFGVGSGVSHYELDYFGVPSEESRPRYSRALNAIVDAWRTGTFTHPEHPERPTTRLSILPVQQPNPPVWYVSSSVGSAQWAGSNGLNLLGRWNGGGFVEAAQAYWDAFRSGDREGRLNPANDAPIVGAAGPVFIADSEAQAHDRFAAAGEFHRQRAIWLWNFNGDHSADGIFVPESMIAKQNALVGTADQVRDQLVAMVEQAEISMFQAQLYEGDMTFEEARENLRRFAALLPSVRDAAAAIEVKRAGVPA